MNEKNRTHLLRSCAATALLCELTLNNSRATNAKVEANPATPVRFSGLGRWTPTLNSAAPGLLHSAGPLRPTDIESPGSETPRF